MAVRAKLIYGHRLGQFPRSPALPLSRRLSVWQEKCQLTGWSERVLRRGYTLQFCAPPPPFTGVLETKMPHPARAAALSSEIAELRAKGALSVVPRDRIAEGCYSTYFLVPKKTGGVRPILDLRRLNRSVATLKFHMLTVRQMLEAYLPGDFCTSIDLKDAYFHVSIAKRDRKFLRFSFLGVAYEYTRLPFGYALAPKTFSNLVELALRPLRQQGIRILAYLDDLLVLAPSPQLSMTHTATVVSHLTSLGFAINWEKSALWPARQIVYLGIHLDTGTMRARLSDPRAEALQLSLSACPPLRPVTALSVMRLLGLMSASHVVVPLGLLHMRGLQRWFARLRLDPVRDRRRWVRLPASLTADLSYWMDRRVIAHGVPMSRVSDHVAVFTDASLSGWGGTCMSQFVGGLWAAGERRHINLLELETVLMTLRHFVHLVRGRDVLVRSDNQTTVAYINRQGGVRSLALHRLAVELWQWAHLNLRSLTARHIAGRLNVGADLMSRGGPHRDEWSLHPQIVALLWSRFGRAEVDLFASRENARCPLWFSLRSQDQPPLGVDAFAHAPWPRTLLYAFPPTGLLMQLLARVRSEAASVILVAPDRYWARWYAEVMTMTTADPWFIPPWPNALSQAGGLLCTPPVLGRPLVAWRLNGGGCPTEDSLQPL